MLFFELALLYVAVGFVVAVAFVVLGASRVLPHAAPLTVGARIMLVPGATLLWPYVLARWLAAR
ncbi:MAG: hypothetical protein JOZ74_07145 [Bradyrhizobium sp.]|nr:hypothetical protein [Bradyrhizobium sp.]